MEEVLDLYAEPYDPERPIVNFDETSKQLVAETRTALEARPAQENKPALPERYDSEYRRNGTRNLFLFCEPKAGWRHIEVTERRTQQDFAEQMEWLVDEAYPDVEVVRVVLDNLNTHRPASLYQRYEPAEARRVLKRLEFHYTPKHGSWLNMAEIEFSILSRQCLKRRIKDEEQLKAEIAHHEERRNREKAQIHWGFTCDDARVKLKRLYPSDIA